MPRRSARRAAVDELVANAREARGIERSGRCFAVGVRNGGRCQRRPSAFCKRDLRATFPWPCRRALAARMRELHRDGHRRRLPPCTGKAVGQRALRCVVVEAKAARRDPPDGRHRGRLDRHHRRAGQQQLAPVDQVPVGRAAFVGRVLAHRRDDDAVRQREPAQRQRIEQMRATLAGRNGHRQRFTLRCGREGARESVRSRDRVPRSARRSRRRRARARQR